MLVYLASQNAHKAHEFATAAANLDIIPAPVALDVDETGSSFIENALLKARAYAQNLKHNALADDSGLCVDALQGAPGIFSARYSSGDPNPNNDDVTTANNKKLLNALRGVPDEKRTAHFTCALALVIVNPDDIDKTLKNPRAMAHANVIRDENNAVCTIEIAFQAHADGIILRALSGNAGFGYDPLFFSPKAGCTFAQLNAQQKLAFSHRGAAIQRLNQIF